MNVLVVEDSDVVRREMERMLLAIEAVDEVVPAASIAEARDLADERRFDAWVLDFELADGTAMDLLQDVDASGDPNRPFVAVITGYASFLLRERCLEAGADAFFPKAEGLDELVAALEEEASRPDTG